MPISTPGCCANIQFAKERLRHQAGIRDKPASLNNLIDYCKVIPAVLPVGLITRLWPEPVTMAGSSAEPVPVMAELIPGLDTVLELLRSPLGAVLFVPLYALWVTLLLPGVWASMLAGCSMALGAAALWCL